MGSCQRNELVWEDVVPSSEMLSLNDVKRPPCVELVVVVVVDDDDDDADDGRDESCCC